MVLRTREVSVGKRGPPPKPTSRKKLEGTYRADRAAPREPEPKVGMPAVPPGLDKLAKEKWLFLAPRLLELRVLTEVDGAALEGYCRAYSRAVRADREVNTYGVTVDTDYGRKTNPATRIARDSWALVNVLGAKLGLSPADRVRINAAPPEKVDTAENELFGRPSLRSIPGGGGGTT